MSEILKIALSRNGKIPFKKSHRGPVHHQNLISCC